MGRNAKVRRARKALSVPRATRRFPGGKAGATAYLASVGRTPTTGYVLAGKGK